MLTKYVEVGNKVEMQSLQALGRNPEEEKKIYYSSVYDIISEDRIELTMPLVKSKLILLPTGGEFELVFYTHKGVYQCFGKIADRYKSDNIYILSVDITSTLKKHQRREYYRYGCSMEIVNRTLTPDEIKAVVKRLPLPVMEEDKIVYDRNVAVDISGGGVRLISEVEYEPHSLIFCEFTLSTMGTEKKYKILGKVLTNTPVENRKDVFEHRVQFLGIRTETREEIIKFIFEEERKNRRKEQG